MAKCVELCIPINIRIVPLVICRWEFFNYHRVISFLTGWFIFHLKTWITPKPLRFRIFPWNFAPKGSYFSILHRYTSKKKFEKKIEFFLMYHYDWYINRNGISTRLTPSENWKFLPSDFISDLGLGASVRNEILGQKFSILTGEPCRNAPFLSMYSSKPPMWNFWLLPWVCGQNFPLLTGFSVDGWKCLGCIIFHLTGKVLWFKV